MFYANEVRNPPLGGDARERRAQDEKGDRWGWGSKNGIAYNL